MKQSTKDALKKYSPSILAVVICLATVMAILCFPTFKGNTEQVNVVEYSSVSAICELATLKNYYHNVVLYEEKPAGLTKVANDVLFWPFGKYTDIGHKQYWLEYSGVVEAGIDASQIKTSGPDWEGVVEVYLPDAKVFNVYADQNSMTEPISETGMFTKITAEEKSQAFAAAQGAMQREAENDQSMLKRAKENAKVLLEKYIVNTGKEMGLKLSIKWIDQG